MTIAPNITKSRDAAARLVRKLWQYCNVLRDDGLSYPDYVEQLTYLLFLKMAAEQNDSPVPESYAWDSIATKDAAQMHRHYSQALQALGRERGMLGVIFRDAKNKIRDPAKLRLLVVDLIGQTDWSGLSADVKGDAYEGLLEKNARDTKSGAGQYFTPRPLIDAIVACVDPRPGEVVCDPACGTGGFLLSAHAHIVARNRQLSNSQRRHLAKRAIRGVELVPEVTRLAAMNLLLHGVGGDSDNDIPVTCADSLSVPPTVAVDVVLTNPPFGVKGSVSYGKGERPTRGNDDLTVKRADFWVQTANKQLNFLQHVVSLLKRGGRAAVVVPDNVLFEGGAAGTIRRRLLETCDVHTLLRLPSGLFYAQGVQANVLFFDRPLRSSDRRLGGPSVTRYAKGRSTKASTLAHTLWVYDLRGGNRFTLKTRPLASVDLKEFVDLFPRQSRSGADLALDSVRARRWQAFEVADLLRSKECSLDLAREHKDLPRAPGGVARLDAISHAIADDLQRAMLYVARLSSSGADTDAVD